MRIKSIVRRMHWVRAASLVAVLAYPWSCHLQSTAWAQYGGGGSPPPGGGSNGGYPGDYVYQGDHCPSNYPSESSAFYGRLGRYLNSGRFAQRCEEVVAEFQRQTGGGGACIPFVCASCPAIDIPGFVSLTEDEVSAACDGATMTIEQIVDDYASMAGSSGGALKMVGVLGSVAGVLDLVSTHFSPFVCNYFLPLQEGLQCAEHGEGSPQCKGAKLLKNHFCSSNGGTASEQERLALACDPKHMCMERKIAEANQAPECGFFSCDTIPYLSIAISCLDGGKKPFDCRTRWTNGTCQLLGRREGPLGPEVLAEIPDPDMEYYSFRNGFCAGPLSQDCSAADSSHEVTAPIRDRVELLCNWWMPEHMQGFN